MKKIVAIVLALALVFTMSAIAFAAASDTAKQTVTAAGDGEAEVLVKVILDDDTIPEEDQPQDPSDVDPKYATYSVTIDASDVVFTYTINDIRSYDASTHTYTDGSWDKVSGNIKVTNDSNTSITVTPAFSDAGATLYNVTAQLTSGTLSLGSAVDIQGTVEGTIGVKIGDDVASTAGPSVSENFKLATVVLTIAGV